MIQGLDLSTFRPYILTRDSIKAYQTSWRGTSDHNSRFEDRMHDLLAGMILYLLLPLHFLRDRLGPSALS